MKFQHVNGSMTSAHHRKKDPEGVRRALIESAARLACVDGFASVSTQAVAAAAGVTKGAFFHHFASKQDLVNAVLDAMFAVLDAAFEREIAAEAGTRGCFTRAYVQVLLTLGPDEFAAMGLPISPTIMIDQAANRKWADWLSGKLASHARTDGDLDLEIVRLAVDGYWMAEICDAPRACPQEMRSRLLEVTRGQAAAPDGPSAGTTTQKR